MCGWQEVSRQSRGEGEEEVSVPPGLLLWQLPLEKAFRGPLIVTQLSRGFPCGSATETLYHSNLSLYLSNALMVVMFLFIKLITLLPIVSIGSADSDKTAVSLSS